MVFVAQRLQHITVAVHSLTLQYLYLRLEDIVRWHTSVFGSSDDVNMKGSELLIIENTGVKNTPSKISSHPHPRRILYIFVFLFSPIPRSVLLFLVNLKAISRQ